MAAISLAVTTAAVLAMAAGCTSSGGSAATKSTAPVSSPDSSASTSAGASTSASAQPSQSVGSQSASGLAATAIAALKAGGAVHVDITNVDSSNKVVFDDYATASGGSQDITIDGTAHATILLIAGVAYVQADEPSLVGFFGVPQTQAAQLAGRWIAVRSGESLGDASGESSYSDIAAGITLSSVASELSLTAPYTMTAPSTISGQAVLGVQAHVPASQGFPSSTLATLYVTSGGSTRPVRYQVGSGNVSEEVSFSQWGVTENLTAPSGAISAGALTPPVTT